MSKRNYNVILIGIDMLRADHLGCHGYHRPTSPNIDAWVGKGWFFENCLSQAPSTAPSFMSIMTGLYPTYHGVSDNIMHIGDKWLRVYLPGANVKTLAEILKGHDYRTAAFTDGGNVSKTVFGRGFDYLLEDSMLLYARSGSGEPIPKDEIFFWLKETAGKPLFLFLHTYVVHNPWFAPAHYRKLFGAGDNLRPKLYLGLSTYTYITEQIINDRSLLAEYKNLYDGAIKYVDDFVGDLINLLEQLKISDDTSIIFTSDHGEEFFEHGMIGHTQFYNELLHVPLIVKIPKTNKPATIRQLVRSIDIMPTIMDLLGIGLDFSVNGISLLPAQEKDLNLMAAAENEALGVACRKKNLKYIYAFHQAHPKRTEELYNLENDPQEQNNIGRSNLDKLGSMFSAYEQELHRVKLPPPQRRVTYWGL